ncbi:MAG: undecaprenyl-diphosphate phosphatase [Nocardioidaceae bacterium]|nr:undecaprenyl-diphosphate phosphatase [Nocardioidaceae bacterium]MCL2615072.1 undecaprenyl-diphosphate phosphatase [Nocardioidaceae bacterium]
MTYFDSVVLGIVEGLTEFLPVSSTGHLTIAEKLLKLPINNNGVTAYTAVIQMGAIFAVLLYFARDIWQIASGWCKGLVKPEYRGTLDHRMGWYVIIGSIPIGIVGFAAKDFISGPLRSLWVVGAALILWSVVMVYAERTASQVRDLKRVTLRDVVMIGIVQCVALVPGVSRSGATISAGLIGGLDRVAATKLSFYLSIPALTGAGLYELKDAVGTGIGVGPTVVGTAISFVVAFFSVAWLLKFVAGHPITAFVPYRVVLGVVLLGLLAAGVMSAT